MTAYATEEHVTSVVMSCNNRRAAGSDVLYAVPAEAIMSSSCNYERVLRQKLEE
jgi:hypothetical protein